MPKPPQDGDGKLRVRLEQGECDSRVAFLTGNPVFYLGQLLTNDDYCIVS